MTILIAYLPTPEGEAALAAGLAEANLRGTDVLIVNSPRRGATIDKDLIDEKADNKLVARAAEQGITARVDHVLHEDLAATIESLAGRIAADLVVIGLRHRSAVGKLLLGSDAQRILLTSTVPVLSVKAVG